MMEGEQPACLWVIFYFYKQDKMQFPNVKKSVCQIDFKLCGLKRLRKFKAIFKIKIQI